jgi:hypothetical protein
MGLNPSIQAPRRLSWRRPAVLWASIALLIVTATIAALLLLAGVADVQRSAPASPQQPQIGVPTAPQQPNVGPGRRISRPGLPVAE